MTKNEIVSVLLDSATVVVFTLGEANRLAEEGCELADEQRIRRRAAAERRLGMSVTEALRRLGDDEAWAKKCVELAETVHQVWTGNEWTKACFEKVGVEVKDIKEVPGISATEIRRRMREGGDWRALVPAEVASYLGELNATDRIKKM